MAGGSFPIVHGGGSVYVDGTTTTAYSDRLGIANANSFSIHLEWTQTSSGACTVTLWTSNKSAPDPDSDTDWVEETAVSITGAAASDSSSMTHIANVNARWAKLKFVRSAGTVTNYGWVQAKR